MLDFFFVLSRNRRSDVIHSNLTNVLLLYLLTIKQAGSLCITSALQLLQASQTETFLSPSLVEFSVRMNGSLSDAKIKLTHCGDISSSTGCVLSL
jgi:hypothetical protein